MNIEIIRSQPESVININLLIRSSKSVWNYPMSYLEKAIPLLMIDTDYLNQNDAFEIWMNDELVGFFAFAPKGTEIHLDHLWIKPSKMNMGIGRKALQFTEHYAKEKYWKELFTYPDPPAEGFYLKNGFINTGLRIPSRIEGGPEFSIFRWFLSQGRGN